MKKIFITATDTDAGKTHIAKSLIYALVKQGHKVAAFKPVSAGCDLVDGQLINEDAFLLAQQANCKQTINQINPIAYQEPIAPHIAAQKSGNYIDLVDLISYFSDIEQLEPDLIVTEGAGGWRLPLGNGIYLSEFAKKTEHKVILVVNMKLGCLNHAILTYESIINDGMECIGWIANCQEEMAYLDENIIELKKQIDSTLLAVIPSDKCIEKSADKLDLTLFN